MAPANKEVTILVLDIGASSSCVEDGQEVSFLDHARRVACSLVERKIFSRPGDLVALIVMGSEQMQNSRGIDHVSVGTPLAVPNFKLIKVLRNKVCGTSMEGCWAGALQAAAGFLEEELGVAKVSLKRVVLISPLGGPAPELDTVKAVMDEYNREKLELILFSTEIWLANEDEKPKHGVVLMRQLLKEVKGTSCTLEEAEKELMFHRRKITNPNAWNVDLCIGTSIKIPVSGYAKTRKTDSIGTWRKYYRVSRETKNEGAQVHQESTSNGASSSMKFEMQPIVTEKTFFKKDAITEAVLSSDVIRGYKYGGSIVPFTELDSDMKYASGDRGLIVLGFTNRDLLPRHLLAGDGLTLIFGRRKDTKANQTLCALVQALLKTKKVAIARRVYAKNYNPNMVALFPVIYSEKKLHCLSMVNLVYKEDDKGMVLPPLNAKYTEENAEVIDSLIASADLADSNFDRRAVNPGLQYIYDCLAHRSLNPAKPPSIPETPPLPPPREILLKMVKPEEEILKKCKPFFDEISKQFPLQVKEKTRGRKYWVNQQLKGDDRMDTNEENLQNIDRTCKDENVEVEVVNIGTINPAADFKNACMQGLVTAAVRTQLTQAVESLVLLSARPDFEKPLEATTALREDCCLNDANFYNTWLFDFKAVLLDRFKTSFFQALIAGDLGLITKAESELSATTLEEAASFGSAVQEQSITAATNDNIMEIDDLFAD